jgi:hypothetical protein
MKSKQSKKVSAKLEASRRKKKRLRAQADLDTRRAQVLRLKWVYNLTNADIAKKFSVEERTIERDFHAIRERSRDDASKNLSNERRDIAEQLKLRHEEIVKLLWNDYFKIAGECKLIPDELAKLRTIGGANPDLILEKQKLLNALSNKGQRILAQITTSDDSFVAQMKQLGIVGSDFEVSVDDGDPNFIEIRMRRKRIEDELRGQAEMMAPEKSKKGAKVK